WILGLRGLALRRIKEDILHHRGCVGAYWFDVNTHEFERWVKPHYDNFLKAPDPRLVLAQLKAAETQTVQLGPVLLHDRNLYSSVAFPFDDHHVLVAVLDGSEIRDLLQR